MAKTLRASEVIKKLQNFIDADGDIEVFVANPNSVQFDGVSEIIGLQTADGKQTHIALFALGDILKPQK